MPREPRSRRHVVPLAQFAHLDTTRPRRCCRCSPKPARRAPAGARATPASADARRCATGSRNGCATRDAEIAQVTRPARRRGRARRAARGRRCAAHLRHRRSRPAPTRFRTPDEPALDDRARSGLDAKANAAATSRAIAKPPTRCRISNGGSSRSTAKRAALEELAFETERAEVATLTEIARGARSNSRAGTPQRGAAARTARARRCGSSGRRARASSSAARRAKTSRSRFGSRGPTICGFTRAAFRVRTSCCRRRRAPTPAMTTSNARPTSRRSTAARATPPRVEIDFTERKYVRKQRDAAPGTRVVHQRPHARRAPGRREALAWDEVGDFGADVQQFAASRRETRRRSSARSRSPILSRSVRPRCSPPPLRATAGATSAPRTYRRSRRCARRAESPCPAASPDSRCRRSARDGVRDFGRGCATAAGEATQHRGAVGRRASWPRRVRRRQPARLVEHAVGHRDLADIVDARRLRELRHLDHREAHLLADRLGKERHPAAVVAGARIAQVDDVGQCVDASRVPRRTRPRSAPAGRLARRPPCAIASKRAPRSAIKLRASETNATGSTGLFKKADAPRLSASRCSSLSLCPVIITIGVVAVAATAQFGDELDAAEFGHVLIDDDQHAARSSAHCSASREEVKQTASVSGICATTFAKTRQVGLDIVDDEDFIRPS